MTGSLYGYIVDLLDGRSVPERLAALREFGVEERSIVTEDPAKRQTRPRFAKLLRRLEAGDTLVVESLGGLGRDPKEIRHNWEEMVRGRVGLVVLDMPPLDRLGTGREALSGLALQLYTYFTNREEQSHQLLQRRGIDAAKENGVIFGAPRVKLPEDFSALVQQWQQGLITSDEAAVRANISRASFYRYAKKWEAR